MSKKKSHKYNINVPCDILFCILIRLPAKSLLRFRSVSRPWNDVISDKKFKKAHSNQSKALGRVNFLLSKYCSSEFKLINWENQRVIATETQCFPLKGFERAHVLCSHDGLVLLKKHRAYKTFVLWNPSTRQCLELASCPYLNTYTIPHASGLCYDPTTDDYKVILIYKPFYLIYSLRNFWTKKTTLPMLEQHLSSSLKRVTINLWSSYICCQGITTEGCVYWSLDLEICPYVRRGSTIIYYDAKLEKLKELQAPIFVGDDNELFLLTTFKGRLCLYGGESTDLWSNETDLDMWIMEEDGWKLLMKLCYVPSTFCEHYFVRHSRLLCCTENGEIIFKGPTNSQISIYYPKKQRFVIKDLMSGYNIGYEYGRDEYPTCLDSLHFPKIVKHKRKRKMVSV